MSNPNYNAAKEYALNRLSHELQPHLQYHNFFHTEGDVLAAVERLGVALNVSEEELLLLRTAALFHDIGFVIQPQDHEEIGIQLAGTVLPRFDYSAGQIKVIAGMISATRVPQNPTNLLEQIIVDADMDVLGRDDFWSRSYALQSENTALGRPTTLAEWHQRQLSFLQSHHYYTRAAHSLREAQKQVHIRQLAELTAVHN